MILRLLVLFLSFHGSLTAIYHLNESEYVRMPAVFHLDPYEPCVSRGGVYCSVRFQLLFDNSSDIADMIREYSKHYTTHYDHTTLQYGICVTETYKNILHRNKTMCQEELLEGYLNETLSRDYGFKAKILDKVNCNNDVEKIKNSQFNVRDLTVAAIIVALLMLNVLGSLNEFQTKENRKGCGFLTCFSVQSNWRRLVAPAGEGPELRLSLLKGFHGLKAILAFFIICGHAMTPFIISSEDTRMVEEAYTIFKYIGNGTMSVQIFFIMSGFLLVFNMELYAETNNLTWTMVFKGILLNWLRLTPSYSVVLALASTWMRFAGSGPLWDTTVTVLVEDCKRDWWLHIINFNNYVDNSQCMPETWYIASDLQLSILGLCTYVLTKGRTRKMVLLLLFVFGLLTPAVHTYFQDLDGFVLLSPEMGRYFLVKDPTFNHVYKRGHTNIACYVIGLSLGLFVFNKLKTDSTEQKEKYKEHRYLYWLTFPAILISLAVGCFFYMDGPRPSIYVRTVYAGVAKPMFGILVAALIAGMVFRVENVYRGIFECNIWTIPGRLSYCAYLVHFCIIRILAGSRTTLIDLSLFTVVEVLITSVAASFLAAIPLYLLVEVPANRLVKLCFRAKNKQDYCQELETKKSLKTE